MDGLSRNDVMLRLAMGLPPSRLKPLVVMVRYALKEWHG